MESRPYLYAGIGKTPCASFEGLKLKQTCLQVNQWTTRIRFGYGSVVNSSELHRGSSGENLTEALYLTRQTDGVAALGKLLLFG